MNTTTTGNGVAPHPIPSPAADAHPTPATSEILAQVSDWSSFDVFELDSASGGKPLQFVTLHLLNTLGIMHRLPTLDPHKLTGFLVAAETRYHPQPYHNNTHAADVVQALGSMMQCDAWGAELEDWERLGMVVAAAVHDLGHPGVNNDFHVRTNSKEAQMFQSMGSINENSHAALALDLLTPLHQDFLTPLGPPTAAKIRSLIKDLILSTDMAHHSGVVRAFTASLERYGPDLSRWQATDRRNALKMFLHCADISNPARPLAHCTEWGRRVQEELYCQGDRERALGLELTPACDRGTVCPHRSQAAFIKHVMRPSIQALQPIAPVFVHQVSPHIDASLEHWQALALARGGEGGGGSPTKKGEDGTGRNGSADVIQYIAP